MNLSLFSQSPVGSGSAWKQMQSWHAKQRQFTAEFESLNSGLMSAITGSFSSTNEGLLEIVMNKAVESARQRVNERAAQSGIDISV